MKKCISYARQMNGMNLNLSFFRDEILMSEEVFRFFGCEVIYIIRTNLISKFFTRDTLYNIVNFFKSSGAVFFLYLKQM